MAKRPFVAARVLVAAPSLLLLTHGVADNSLVVVRLSLAVLVCAGLAIEDYVLSAEA